LDSQVSFWETFYRECLAEFFYLNGLTEDRCIRLTVEAAPDTACQAPVSGRSHGRLG
jgi:hypothetical protein